MVGWRGSLRTMHGGGSAPSCCAFTHRVAFEEGSGPHWSAPGGGGPLLRGQPLLDAERGCSPQQLRGTREKSSHRSAPRPPARLSGLSPALARRQSRMGRALGAAADALLQGIFPPRDQTLVSHIVGGFFTS